MNFILQWIGCVLGKYIEILWYNIPLGTILSLNNENTLGNFALYGLTRIERDRKIQLGILIYMYVYYVCIRACVNIEGES